MTRPHSIVLLAADRPGSLECASRGWSGSKPKVSGREASNNGGRGSPTEVVVATFSAHNDEAGPRDSRASGSSVIDQRSVRNHQLKDDGGETNGPDPLR